MNKLLMAGAGILVGSLATTIIHAQTTKTSPAFMVVEFTMKDPETFKEYGQRVPAVINQYGGRFVVRPTSKPEKLAGEVPKGPFAIITFESTDQAQKFASSPEYQALVPIRDKGADTRAFIVEGEAL